MAGEPKDLHTEEIPAGPDPSGTVDSTAQIDRPDTTGEFIPESAEYPPPGGADTAAITGAYVTSPSPVVTDTTGEFISSLEAGADTAALTGAYVPPPAVPEADATAATGAFTSEGSAAPPAPAKAAEQPQPTSGSKRYVPQRFHAKGGMGEIWLAEDSSFGRSVALKRMFGRARSDQKDRFFFEAQVTGQLEHPGIVPVHELGVDEEGRPFYIMKFVRGRTLKDVLKEYHASDGNAETPREVQRLRLLQVFVDLCQTVGYAHSRGILHRDLKPDNVMLGSYGETLVLDWGLAKIVGQSEPQTGDDGEAGTAHLSYTGSMTETQAGVILGSPYYMSPEVASAEETDQRSDVYLLGATLYEILTGRPPREGKYPMRVIEQARKESPPPARTVKAEVPRPLEAICLKAMAFRKDDRYQTALALAEDVQRYLAGEPVSAYRETFLERAWRWARKHRRALTWSAVAVVLLTAGLIGYAKIREADRNREAARLEAENLRQLDQARKDVEEFHRLSDEARFFAANASPLGERTPCFDPGKAEEAARAALNKAEPWGPDLQGLLLEQKRDEVKKEMYDLLLLTAQVRAVRPLEAASARETLGLLDRASTLRGTTRGYHRLRGEFLRFLGDPRAAEDQRHADDPATATTALDYFLMGEYFRTQSAGQAGTESDKPAWEPHRNLMLRAVEQYRLALRIDPNHYWSHYQLGRCYLSLGQGAEAVETLGTCIALRPESVWGYSARGLALALQKRYDEAEADLNEVLRRESELRSARLNRGVVYLMQKKYEPALADFDAVLLPPDDRRLVEAAYYRGLLHLERAQYKKALEDLDRVGGEKPDLRLVFRLRALVRFAMGDEERGLKDLDAFLAEGKQYDPESGAACAQRGRLLRLFIQELPPDAHGPTRMLARRELKKAIDRGEKKAQVYDDYGAVLEGTDGLRAAINDAYSPGLDVDGKHVKMLIKRGWAYAILKDYDRARKDFAEASKLEADNAEAHTGLGYVHALTRAHAEALREANLALLHKAGDYLILHNVACIYAELAMADAARGQEYEEQALDLLHRAVELWRKGETGPDEASYIEGESAFRRLRLRPDFKDRVFGGKP